MKRILAFMIALMFISPVVFADRNTSSFHAGNSSTLVKRGDWKIYHIDFISTTNAGNFTIYDELTPVTESKIRTEGQQATALNDVHLDFSTKPLEGSTGLYLEITTGNIVIEYE